jgi:hypothetical protein
MRNYKAYSFELEQCAHFEWFIVGRRFLVFFAVV